MKKCLDDLMNATADEVAVAFIAWLADSVAAESNRRKYALHLTEARTHRLHTPQYPGPYNLFLVRGYNAVNAALSRLESTDAYRASQRSNGGNGVFQAVFGKLRDFWTFLHDGGLVAVEAINLAAIQWAIVRERVHKEGF